MDSFFIIADNAKTTHCAGKGDNPPIVSGALGKRCGPGCRASDSGGSHHDCAASKVGETSARVRYCECSKNEDGVEHYFSVPLGDIQSSYCICYWCQNNCREGR